jgi:hypothetical protein
VSLNGPDNENLGRRKYDGEFITFREAVDKFVTRDEFGTFALQVRSDLSEMKVDLKVVVRNQLPPWFLPAVLVVVAAFAILAQHFWK